MLAKVLRKHCLRVLAYLVVFLGYFTTDVLGELCKYKKRVYNVYTNSYDKIEGLTRECEWGCCYHHNSPCCSVPMKLIIGCILGGLGGCSLLILAVCCVLYCMRNARKRTREQRRRSSATRSVGRDAIFYSNTSSSTAVVPDPMCEPPPSYEEVMRGSQNQAFKDDDPDPA